MEKHRYIGKTKEEAISNATIDLQETQDNLIIKELEEIKGGLFKSKKIEIEVVERREVIKYIKEYIQKLLKNLGFTANIEIKNKDEIPTYTIYSDNDALLIGRNGKNLKALTIVTSQHILNELGKNFKFIIIYIFTFSITTLLLSILGIDGITALSASIVTLGNVGPGFGNVSSLGNYSALPDAAKYILSANMLMGRLEIMNILALILMFIRKRDR